MALGEKIRDWYGNLITGRWFPGELSFGDIIRGGIRRFMDEFEEFVGGRTTPILRRVSDSENVPPDYRELIRDAAERRGAWQAIALVVLTPIIIGMLFSGLLKPFLRLLEYEQERIATSARLDGMDAARAFYWDPEHQGGVESDLRDLGWSDWKMGLIMDMYRPLLDPDRLRELELREAPEFAAVEDNFRKAGYTDAQITAMRVLYWRIPPAPDLIRMAVREVFSPEIVQRFGQMEDFELHAAHQGISREWALNYWAAHWDLPSVTQAFEMYHRLVRDPTDFSGGSIGSDEGGAWYRALSWDNLELLLRAQDVMPGWRDPLTRIAHTLLTRVDLRRLLVHDIVSRDFVKFTYQSRGYTEEDAELLTQLAESYADTDELEEVNYTRAEILDGYRKGMLSEGEARELLSLEGYTEAQQAFYLAREDYKHDKQLHDAYLSRGRTLFIEGVRTLGEVRTLLSGAGVPSAEIDRHEPLWELDRLTRVAIPSKAELRRFRERDIISDAEWAEQLRLRGYDPAAIAWFREDAEFVEPEPEPSELVRPLSKAELDRFFVRGIIDDSRWTQGLRDLRYAEADIDLARQDLAFVRAEEVKPVSKADALRLYSQEIITEAIFDNEMMLLGYNEQRVQWYKDQLGATPPG